MIKKSTNLTLHQIIELANPCLWDDIDDESNEDGECEKNLKTFIAQHKSEIPTAAEICT